ncbi:hypothetical protein VPH35_019528 [Triticum aestivum]
MFTRNNRMDYQLFFNTRGAFRPVGWNGLVAVLCLFDVFVIFWKENYLSDMMLLLSMVMIFATARFLSGLTLNICNPLRRATSLWSPLVAILLMVPPLSNEVIGPSTSWIVFTALLVPVLLVTISRLQFTRIVKLADSILGIKHEIWCRVVINLWMIAALGIQVYMLHLDPFMDMSIIMMVQVCALVVVSFGNFQVPAAVLRICLASLRLQHKYKDDEQNLAASLKIFYWMVLGQGILYVVACILEFFSFIPRRFLVHCGGFREGVLAPMKISLSNFAMDSVNLDSSKNQLHGIRLMHSFLQWEPTKAQLLSTLTTSTKTVARIIRMLDRTSPKDTGIRIYAAMVTTELAKNLRVVTIPGTVQLVSALLDTDIRLKRGNPLLDTYHEQEEIHDPVKRSKLLVLDTENLMQTQTSSTQQVGIYKKKSFMLRCWQRFSEFWSMPKDQLLTDHDLLPALAMSIIDSLASCDQDICVEISKADYLIPKIIGFTSYRSDTMNTEAQQKILLKSSLKVLQRLTSIGGEIGTTLRYKISKHPFLLSNLSDILGDNSSSQESRKLVAEILKNIAIDEKTRQDIGCVEVIITKLVQAFLYAEGTMNTNADHLLRKVAGQALAMLTIESVHNCLVILKEPELMKELKTMILIHDNKYIYVAASVLSNLSMHARSKLKESDLQELSHTLREVLERIMGADGAELEILIGLSSQTCKVIPEEFTRQLDNDPIKQRFLKRLVDILNANMKPSAHCPGIRRVILEQVIHLMECNPRYADCFNEFKIIEALSRVEQTVSKAENYKLFMADAGFMEYSTPMSALVARAKELMSRD